MKLNVLTVVAVMGLALPVFAQPDAKKPAQPAKPAAPARPAAPATPAEKAPPAKPADAAQPGNDDMMKQMMEFGAPTKAHQGFKVMEGTWSATLKMWEAPNTEPTEAKGTMTNTLIHGGRYLHHEYKGDFMGMEFSGSGDFGFNKATGKYEGTWLDSFGTGIMVLSGSYDEATKTYTSTGEFDMPGPDGKMMKVKQRETVRIDGPDKHSMVMYHTAAGTPEMKIMEISYSRGGGKPTENAKPSPKANDHK